MLFRGRFSVEPSYAKVENLVFGRMAFRGMNPEIEKMMEAERLKEEEEAAARRETEVNDEAMAAHFGALRATVGRKFATKRELAASSSGASTSSFGGQDGEGLLRRGEELLGQARSQHMVWKKEDHPGHQAGAAAGRGRGGGGGGKRKKFMKPPQD